MVQTLEKLMIFSEGEFSVFLERSFNDQVIALLKETIWGTGETTYSHGGNQMQLKEMHDPYVITLCDGEIVKASIVFCKREVYMKGEKYNSFYIRYFSAHSSIKGKGIIKSFCENVFDYVYQNAPERTLFYALVEKDNLASKRIIDILGFRLFRTISTIGFSRVSPKTQANVFGCCDCERDVYENLLHSYYKNFSFFQLKSLFLKSDYHVYRVNGEILAGVQVHKSMWVVKNLKGAKGVLLRNLVPKIPYLRRIFNPEEFKFLGLESIYVKPGHEDELLAVIEYLLHKHKLNSALFFSDKESELTKVLQERGDLGLISRFTGNTEAQLMIKTKEIDEDVIYDLLNLPAFVSAYDTI